MKSKTFFINRGIFRNDIKSWGWVSVAYLLGLLLCIPLKIMMLYSHNQARFLNNPNLDFIKQVNSQYLQIFQGQSEFYVIFTITVPVIMGILLFNYLQNKKAADILHTLPVKREALFTSHVIAGIIFLALPLIITALISWFLIAALGIEAVTFTHILKWLGISLLINILFFLSTVFTGIFTGMSSVQGILTYILLILPTGLTALICGNLGLYVYGFPDGYYLQDAEKLSPLLKLVAGSSGFRFSLTEITIYLLIIIFFYLLGMYAYKKRPIEMASNPISFKSLQPVFVFGVSFCSALLFGSYFYGVQNSIGWACFGYVLGSFLGFFISKIILQKSVKVFNLPNFKGLGLFLLSLIIMIGILHFDITGYEKKVPDLAKVDSIYMDSGFYRLRDLNKPIDNELPYSTYEENFKRPVPIFKDDASLAAINDLHKKIAANSKQLKTIKARQNISYEEREYIALAYKMQDGSKIYRAYSVPREELYAELKAVYELPEYKYLHYDIFNVDASKIDLLTINPNGSNKSLKISDPELIEQAIAVLKTDIRQASYEDMRSYKPAWAEIALTINDRRQIYFSWEKSYTNFENWLKDVGKYENARLIPGQDINFALLEIATPQNNGEDKPQYNNKREYILELEKKPEALKITDPQQMEICLRNFTHSYRSSNYIIHFVLKNGNIMTGYLTEKDAPLFVNEHFNKKQAN